MASLTNPFGIIPFGLFALFSISCQGNAEETQDLALQQMQNNNDCSSVPWNYTNVGAPYMRTWCTSCHHIDLPEEERAGASLEVNLDSYSDIILHLDRIQARALSEPATMPPAGGPSDIEKQRLREWIVCGAPQ